MVNHVRVKYAMRSYARKHGLTVPAGFAPAVPRWGEKAKVLAWRVSIHAKVTPTTQPIQELLDVLFPPSVGDLIVRRMLRDVGVHESPAGSNWGDRVRAYLGAAGIAFPAAWCAAFRCFHQRKVLPGVPLPALPAFVGVGGWASAHQRHPDHYRQVPRLLLRRGDYVTLWNNAHIETFVSWIIPGVLAKCVGGNTSTVGKASNGGAVCITRRYTSEMGVCGRVRR